MKLSHEEYVLQQRKKVAKLASDVLEGELSILKAAIEIVKIRFELDVDENDKDLIAFVAIESEIDHLPIGPERKYWNEDALKEKDQEIKECEKWVIFNTESVSSGQKRVQLKLKSRIIIK